MSAVELKACRYQGGSPLVLLRRSGEQGSVFACGTMEGEWIEVALNDKELDIVSPVVLSDDELLAVSLSEKGDRCLVGAANAVNCYDYPVKNNAVGSLVHRCSLNITQAQFVNDDSVVVIASREPNLIVCSMVGSEVKHTHALPTAGAPVRAFAVQKAPALLAYVDEDGNAFIHSMEFDESSDYTRVHFEQLMRLASATSKDVVRSHSEYDCSISWSPKGTLLAIPSSKGAIILASSASGLPSSWKEEYLISDRASQFSHGNSDVCWVEFSPDGLYLVSIDVAGTVLIWDMETKEAVAKNNATDRIRCARWGAGLPKTICVLSGDGIGLLKVAVAPQRNRAAGQKKHSTASPPTEAGKFVAIARNESNGGIRSALSAGENSSTTMDPKRTPVPGTKRLLRASTTNPEDSDDSEVLMDDLTEIRRVVMQTSSEQTRAVFDDQPADDDMEDDVDDAVQATAGGDAMPTVMSEMVMPEHSMQAPFQPGATLESSQRRYLAWNADGIILSSNEGTFNTIQIDFTDTGMGRQQRFTDHYGFTLGAMSLSGAVFATATQDDTNSQLSGSVVYFRPFVSVSTNAEWTIHLAEGEEAVAVAAGEGWVAVCTNTHMLRTFSITGLQQSVVWIDGPCVAMCGNIERLIVVYHRGAPVRAVQTMGYKLFRVLRTGCTILSEGALPLTPKSGCALSWIGFSDFNQPTVMDSERMLSTLQQEEPAQWVPVLNIKDRYWPVCVKSNKLLAVRLRGEECFPQTHPRPVTNALSLTIPLVPQKNKDIMQWEQQLAYAYLLLSDLQVRHADALVNGSADVILAVEEDLNALHKETDKILIRLLQAACVANSQDRALDLCQRIALAPSYSICAKVLDHYGMTSLAQRVKAMGVEKNDNDTQSSWNEAHQSVNHKRDDLMIQNHDKDENKDFLTEDDVESALLTPGKLSRKASVKYDQSETQQPAAALRKPVNPFAKGPGVASPNTKRRALEADTGLDLSLISSPPPKLARNSSFANAARSKKRFDRVLI